jgi:hypothetical protein
MSEMIAQKRPSPRPSKIYRLVVYERTVDAREAKDDNRQDVINMDRHAVVQDKKKPSSEC